MYYYTKKQDTEFIMNTIFTVCLPLWKMICLAFKSHNGVILSVALKDLL